MRRLIIFMFTHEQRYYPVHMPRRQGILSTRVSLDPGVIKLMGTGRIFLVCPVRLCESRA